MFIPAHCALVNQESVFLKHSGWFEASDFNFRLRYYMDNASRVLDPHLCYQCFVPWRKQVEMIIYEHLTWALPDTCHWFLSYECTVPSSLKTQRKVKEVDKNQIWFDWRNTHVCLGTFTLNNLEMSTNHDCSFSSIIRDVAFQINSNRLLPEVAPMPWDAWCFSLKVPEQRKEVHVYKKHTWLFQNSKWSKIPYNKYRELIQQQTPYGEKANIRVRRSNVSNNFAFYIIKFYILRS